VGQALSAGTYLERIDPACCPRPASEKVQPRLPLQVQGQIFLELACLVRLNNSTPRLCDFDGRLINFWSSHRIYYYVN
jgi:hypothetical protein